MESNSKSNKKTSMLSNIGWSFAERMLPQLVTLLVSVVLARLLAPEHYGIIAIVTVFTALADALATGGLGNALVQKKNADVKDFNSVCWISLGLAVIIYGILYVTAPAIAGVYQNQTLVPILRIMGLKIIFSAFNSVQHAYVQKNMIFHKSFIAAAGGTLIAGVTGITMAFTGFGIWALVAQYMANAVSNTIILFFLIDWKPKAEIAWMRIKALWNYGIKVLGATLVFTVRDNIRTLIVGKQFSSQDLAFYNQGQKYPSMLVVDVVEALGKVIFPVLSNKQDDRAQMKETMRAAIRVSNYIMMPLMLGLLAVSDTFVYAVLTEKWAMCIPFLRIMCLVYVWRPLSAFCQKGLLAVGKSNLNLAHEAITSTTTILMLIVAVFAMESVVMIAWSQAAVAVLGTALYVFWARKYLRYTFKELAQDYLPSLGISLLMVAVVYGMSFIEMNTVILLILQVLVGAGIYVACSALFKLEAFKYLLDAIKGIYKR